MGFVWILVFLVLPFGLYWLAERVKLFKLFGPVVLGYVLGMILGNIPGLRVHAGAAEVASAGAIVLALPLLLFKVDFMGWLKTAGQAVGAYAAAVFSVLVMAMVAYIAFADNPNRAMLSGMFTGAATGGTVNLNSVALAANASSELVLRANFVDIIAGGVYLLFLMGPGKFWLRQWLGHSDVTYRFDRSEYQAARAPSTGGQMLIGGVKQIGLAVLIAFAMLVVAVGFMAVFVIPSNAHGRVDKALAHPSFLPIFFFALTTGGILMSFSEYFRTQKYTEETADYLIIVFALALGSQVDFSQFNTNNLDIMFYGLTIIYGSIILHYILCRLFKIDADSAIMASGAAVLSPPLLPPIAEVLDNKQALISGLTTGMVGYAVGTYLGVLLVELLPGLLG